jgi:D-lactate dehydrogenase
VILTDNPRAHVTHLKSLPTVEPEVDRCIECGFCEPVCPSRHLTLTPRRRIAVRREMARLRQGGDPATLAELHADFEYDGLATCAADGLCATACPVKIDTGALVKRLRGEAHSSFAGWVAREIAARFHLFERLMRLLVRSGHVLERVVGVRVMLAMTQLFERLLRVRLPKWSAALPHVPPRKLTTGPQDGPDAIYYPACMSRIMGRSRGEARSMPEVLVQLAERAGVRLRIPEGSAGTCCGLAFGSKGFTAEHARLLEALVTQLWTWSGEGQRPVVIDATSCLQSMLASAMLLDGEPRRRLQALKLVDSVEFVRTTLLPRLAVRKLPRRVALHPTCASRKLELVDALRSVAEQCASEVTVPIHLGCCAMAGDRGLLYPELTADAVSAERRELMDGEFDGYYSSNLTCEIGMSQATGRPYRSILYLVEEATRRSDTQISG